MSDAASDTTLAAAPASCPIGPDDEQLELLVWAAALRRDLPSDWYYRCGTSKKALGELAQAYPEKLKRIRLLRTVGGLLDRAELARLLRARAAELVLKVDDIADLASLLRVFDKLPGDGGVTAAASRPAADPGPGDDDLTGYDLETAVAEARRLLSELEEPPAADVPGEEQ